MLCGPPGFTGERMCTPGHCKETEAACVATDPTPARHAQPTVYISLPPPPHFHYPHRDLTSAMKPTAYSTCVYVHYVAN